MNAFRIVCGVIYAILIGILIFLLVKRDPEPLAEVTEGEYVEIDEPEYEYEEIEASEPCAEVEPATEEIEEYGTPAIEETNPVDNFIEDIIEDTGNRGALKMTLVWDDNCDLDLHVNEPDGTHIYFGNRNPGGNHGNLDRDNVSGGPHSIENVYWDNPMSGNYNCYVKLYDCSDDYPNVTCTLVVFKNGREYTRYTHTLTQVREEYYFPNIYID